MFESFIMDSRPHVFTLIQLKCIITCKLLSYNHLLFLSVQSYKFCLEYVKSVNINLKVIANVRALPSIMLHFVITVILR